MQIKRNYNSCALEFVISEQLDQALKAKNIDTAKLFSDDWFWFEVELFENLVEDGAGLPDARFGKQFIVRITGIIDEFVDDEPKGVFSGIANDENKVYEGSHNVESKAILTFDVLKTCVRKQTTPQ